jgi:hypothetical protein
MTWSSDEDLLVTNNVHMIDDEEHPAASLDETYCNHVAGVNCCGECECITNTVAAVET